MTATVLRLPWPPEDLIDAAVARRAITGRDRQRAADYMVVCQGHARRRLEAELPQPFDDRWRGAKVDVEFRPPGGTEFTAALLKRASLPGLRGVAAVIGVKIDDWQGRMRCAMPFGPGEILLRVEPVR